MRNLTTYLIIVIIASCGKPQTSEQSQQGAASLKFTMADYIETEMARANHYREISVLAAKIKDDLAEFRASKLNQADFVSRYNENVTALTSQIDQLGAAESKLIDIYMYKAELVDQKNADKIVKENPGIVQIDGAARLMAASSDNRELDLKEDQQEHDQEMDIRNFAFQREQGIYRSMVERLRLFLQGQNEAHARAMKDNEAALKNSEQPYKLADMGMNLHHKGIEAIGKGLKNQEQYLSNVGASLENSLKYLDVVLKALFVNAWQAYVQSYQHGANAYSTLAVKLKDSSKVTMGAALRAMKRYNSTMNMCHSRLGRELSRQRRITNEPTWARAITSLSDLEQSFAYFEKDTLGSACLNKSMLSDRYGIPSLQNLSYGKTRIGNFTSRFECPVEAIEFDEEDIVVADYPNAIFHRETGQIIGYYKALTPYQFYRLFRQRDVKLTFNRTPPNQVACSTRGSSQFPSRRGTKAYFERSREYEQISAEGEDVLYEPNHGRSYGWQIAKDISDPVHKDVVSGFIRIFDNASHCVQNTRKAASDPIYSPKTVPVEVGKAISSAMATYEDETMPYFAKSIRDCAMEAETYRFTAMSNLEVQKDFTTAIKDGMSMPPPQAPMPAQFQVLPKK